MGTMKCAALTVIMTAWSCGKATKNASDVKIVGGAKVTASDPIAKSTVALLDSAGDQFCTGSLIDSQHVLTASHCLEDYTDSRLFVAFGLSSDGAVQAKNYVAASTYRQNPNFDIAAMDDDVATRAPNDIALVTLSKAAPSGYTAVGMLSLNDNLTVGETLTLAGYGMTDAVHGSTAGILRKANVKLTNLSKKSKEIEFGDSNGRSACMGDSGGPAFVARGGQLKLVGVTSRGSASCDDTGIYTDVRYFRDWISTASR